MNDLGHCDWEIEPERYELADDPLFAFGLDRRDFFRIAGAGIVVALVARDTLGQQDEEERPRGGRFGSGGQQPQDVAAWLHVGRSSAVTVYCGKAEVGQNIRTSLTQAVAEELRIGPDRIHMVLGDTQLVPFDAGTFGSRTTPAMAAQLRRVAAAARQALFDLAAQRPGVDRQRLAIEDGRVVDTQSKKSFEFGELTNGQKLVKVVARDQSTAPAKDWKIAGTSVPKVDGRSFVTGTHRYASDVRCEGVQFARVLRPPSYGADLASLDTAAAAAIDGVTVVRDGDFVGVVAPTQQTADRALSAIRAEWKTKPQPSSVELYEYLKAHPATGRGGGARGGGGRQGSVEDALAAAAHKLDASYTIAYIAHAPLEPRAAVAQSSDDGTLTVWTGTQRPFGVRGEVARAVGVAENRVRVIVPDTGSGYGGKHTGEAAVEAARLAKASGKAVKLVWTREEEFTWAYFRPAGVIDIKAGIASDGTLTAWECHNYNSGGSGLRTPYAVANQVSQFHATESPLRQGSYRALAATANHFARESHMDDLARAAGLDPLEFRLKNLKDERLRAVLVAAAERFGWGKVKPAAGQGVGIAGGTEKGSYVATCALVSADRESDELAVVRLVSAFECGAVVNPEHLKNQIEGAMVMGLGGALFEAIEFADGRIANPRFSKYRVPRFGDVPELEAVLVDRRDLPSTGAGETPIVTTAPAVGNAIFAATGARIRSLPMVPRGLKEIARRG
ncbi:MAG: xanthine dehydrogenase family protein molybdopterin-binding subunit [Planctomycetia bacterium]|nr:xanthine dehydrogenase family protein molybdopterin-binding subunit [Planctomycetia bacterium]